MHMSKPECAPISILCVSKPSGVYFGRLTIQDFIRNDWSSDTVTIDSVVTVQNTTNYLFS